MPANLSTPVFVGQQKGSFRVNPTERLKCFAFLASNAHPNRSTVLAWHGVFVGRSSGQLCCNQASSCMVSSSQGSSRARAAA